MPRPTTAPVPAQQALDALFEFAPQVELPEHDVPTVPDIPEAAAPDFPPLDDLPDHSDAGIDVAAEHLPEIFDAI